jgi:hypothetical protein
LRAFVRKGDLLKGVLNTPYPPARNCPHNGSMTKHTHKTRLARLNRQKSNGLAQKGGAVGPRALPHTDYMLDRWIKSLGVEDRALYDSQFRPCSPTPVEHHACAIPKTPPRKKTKGLAMSQQPSKREAKIAAQQRIAQENFEKDQRALPHIDALILKFIATLSQEEQDEIHNGWKKSIRPYQEPT